MVISILMRISIFTLSTSVFSAKSIVTSTPAIPNNNIYKSMTSTQTMQNSRQLGADTMASITFNYLSKRESISMLGVIIYRYSWYETLSGNIVKFCWQGCFCRNVSGECAIHSAARKGNDYKTKMISLFILGTFRRELQSIGNVTRCWKPNLVKFEITWSNENTLSVIRWQNQTYQTLKPHGGLHHREHHGLHHQELIVWKTFSAWHGGWLWWQTKGFPKSWWNFFWFGICNCSKYFWKLFCSVPACDRGNNEGAAEVE